MIYFVKKYNTYDDVAKHPFLLITQKSTVNDPFLAVLADNYL